jgi:hypothetical protein
MRFSLAVRQRELEVVVGSFEVRQDWTIRICANDVFME